VTLTASVRELQKKLGDECLNEAYNHLKTALYDDRRLRADINQDGIQRDLAEIVDDADDRFRLEQLLFWEMQISP